MNDETFKKISNLKMLNNIFICGMFIVGIITIIDLFVPDPIFLLDEAALAAITALFKVLSSVVEKKIDLLSNGQDVEINGQDASLVTGAFKDTVDAVKKSRKK